MIPWSKITFLGDTIVMLPAAMAILGWLAVGRAWRIAFWWATLFAFGLGLVAATKIAFIGWGIGSVALDFTGISGHAMRAAAVLPVLAYLVSQRWRAPAKFACLVLGLGAGLMISISRVVLSYHSVSETVAGWLLGSAVALGFIRCSLRLSKPYLNRWLLAVSLLALVPTAYANPAPTGHWVNAVALYLSGHERPYVRADLLRHTLARPERP
ncbi:MAG: phosphatase PAP2 family protein [Noviherbaspirillum sp.]